MEQFSKFEKCVMKKDVKKPGWIGNIVGLGNSVQVIGYKLSNYCINYL